MKIGYQLADGEKWISVEDRLPGKDLEDKNQEIYVITAEIYDGLITGVDKAYFKTENSTFWIPFTGEQLFPTHWTLLPTPPVK